MRDFINVKEGIIQDNQALTDKYDDQIHKQMESYLLEFGKENGYDYVFLHKKAGIPLVR